MKTMYLLIVITVYSILVGCTTLLTEKSNLKSLSKGVRVFPPKTYLFVNAKLDKTDIYILPDYANAYDVNLLTIVSNQKLNVKLDNGMLTDFSIDQDTTSFTNLFKEVAAATKETSSPKSAALTQNSIDGTFGLDDGVYVISETGNLSRLIN